MIKRRNDKKRLVSLLNAKTRISSLWGAKRVEFKLDEPTAREVLLVGSFTDWQAKPVILEKDEQGLWKASVSLKSGSHEYKFVVDGSWQNDPANPKYAENPFGSRNSVIEIT